MAYKKGRPLLDDSCFFRLASFLFFHGVWPICFTMINMLYSTKILNKRYLNRFKQGIIVSNHTTFLDPISMSSLVRPRRLFHTLLEETVTVPFLGTLTRLLGGIPVPKGGRDSIEQLIKVIQLAMKRRRFVHIYPEGECFIYNQNVKEFLRGAFLIAARLNVPVIPVATIMSEGRFKPYSFFGRSRPKQTLSILPAVYPQTFDCITSDGKINVHGIKMFAKEVQDRIQAEIDSKNGSSAFYKGQMERIKGINDVK